MEVEALDQVMERLLAAAESLERSVLEMGKRGGAVEAEAEERLGCIVATVESEREAELSRRLEAAEQRIAELTAAAVAAPVATVSASGRKTVSAGTAAMLAKGGVSVDGLEAGAVDAALGSLSIEQRFAVKAELLRAGLLGLQTV